MGVTFVALGLNSSTSLSHDANLSVHLPFLTVLYMSCASSAGSSGPSRVFFSFLSFSSRHFLNLYQAYGKAKQVGTIPRTVAKMTVEV